MSNPVLQSESFERAAYNLVGALADFPGRNFGGYIDQFEWAVNKLGRIASMQAANDIAKSLGSPLPYGEHDFLHA